MVARVDTAAAQVDTAAAQADTVVARVGIAAVALDTAAAVLAGMVVVAVQESLAGIAPRPVDIVAAQLVDRSVEAVLGGKYFAVRQVRDTMAVRAARPALVWEHLTPQLDLQQAQLP